MINSAKTVLLFSILFSACRSIGFIYKIDRWENGSQTIFTLSDWHESIFCEKHIGNKQRREMVQAAVELDACIIVEDMLPFEREELIRNPLQYDYNKNNNYLMPYFDHQYSPFDPPIIGLTAYCHQIRVPVDNIEFRLLETMSLQGMPIDPITVLSLEKKIIEEIEEYNDGPLLNEYYKKKLEEYLNNVKALELFWDACCKIGACSLQEATDKVIQELKANGHNINKEAFKKIIDLHNLELLDLRIIHSIYQHREHSTLFICAGGAHIANIEPILQKMGFVRKEELGQPYQIKNDRAIEPDIVDIAQYFNTNKTVIRNRLKKLQRKLITQHDVQAKKIAANRRVTFFGLGTTIAGLLLCHEELASRFFKRDTYLVGAGLALEGIATMLYGFYRHHIACTYKQELFIKCIEQFEAGKEILVPLEQVEKTEKNDRLNSYYSRSGIPDQHLTKFFICI